MQKQGVVVAVCISKNKGERKKNIGCGNFIVDFGLENDAHAGKWHRQVSLLAQESIQKMIDKGLSVGPGDFAENLTIEGLDLLNLPLGTVLEIGDALLKVSQIGKECLKPCAIYQMAGDCVMPREGIFATVEKSGLIKAGDKVNSLMFDVSDGD